MNYPLDEEWQILVNDGADYSSVNRGHIDTEEGPAD